MKKHLLKTFFVCLLALAGTTASAYDFEADGIYYDLNATDQTASVTKNGYYNYSGTVHIPEKVVYNGRTYNVTSIGYEAFSSCSGLTELTIPNSVTSIGDGAFFGCSGLTELTIPNSVTTIGRSAFAGCSGLTELTIPNNVTVIGNYAFSACSSLERIVVEAGNSRFDSREDCNAIITSGDEATLVVGCKNTRIPNSVTAIGADAFSGCSGLTELTIPNSVTSIGDNAFSGCSGLTELTIPNSVTSIGKTIFSNCSGLEKITMEYGNPNYDSRGICNAIIRTANNEMVTGCKNTHIPNSVTSIGYGAFFGCSGLTELTIPNSVKIIGRSAFSGCSGLTELTIGNSVTFIEDYAFSGCSSLISVTSLNTTPPSSINYIFDYEKIVQQNATLHVPAGCKEAYAQAYNWKNFLNIQEDAVDGIAPVVARQQPTADAIYTIDGVKLNAASLQDLPSGIYIVNGKKVSVK